MRSLIVHGRQPALGRAELESLYGSEKIKSIGDKVTSVDVDPCLLAFDRLGGAVKFCKILTELETTAWKDIEQFLIQVSPGHSERMPAGKMNLGLSTIGFDIPVKQINVTALKIKKAIRKTGRNVRVVPNKSAELNTAQVLHNRLSEQTGWEIILIQNSGRTTIAQTVKVQDIESYARRDRERPKRDSRVGMLPPKLAQIIINLAVGELPDEARQSICDIPPDMPIPMKHYAGVHLLDPFCGTGVILQEALLMGYDAYGTDLEPRMIEYAKANLDWLLEQPENRISFPADSKQREYVNLATGDATTHRWTPAPTVIATETYLGRAFSSRPNTDELNKQTNNCDKIITQFLKNIRGQIKSGTRLCVAVPAWKARKGFLHLPTLDKLSDLGYNRLSFVHVSDEDLVYHREGQIVGRELIILERK